jgi:hypothetical protein
VAIRICAASFLALAFATLGVTAQQYEQTLTFRTIAEHLRSPFGIDYLPADDAVFVTVEGERGRLVRAIGDEGETEEHASVASAPSQTPIAGVPDSNEQFGEGEVFVGTAKPGQVARIEADHRTVHNPWVELPGETGVVRGLFVDRSGAFNGDLIVGTTSGNVWRVNNDAHPSLVAATGLSLDSVLVLPAAPDRYDTLAGTVLAAAGPADCRLLTITPAGDVTTHNLGVCPRDVAIVAPESDMVAVLTGTGRLVRAAASQFRGLECHVVASQFGGPFVHLSPNGNTFAASLVGPALDAEGITFRGNDRACQPEICGDNIDNNGNGEVDEGCDDMPSDTPDDDSVPDAPPPCPRGQARNAAGECEAVPKDAACPVDYWQRHIGEWRIAVPSQMLASLFAIDRASEPVRSLDHDTFQQALKYTDGSDIAGAARHLLRSATAALWSASHERVGYPMTSRRLVAQVNAALASGRDAHMRALSSVLDAFNMLSCPLEKSPKRQ